LLEIIKCYIGCTIFLLTVYIFGRIIFGKNNDNKHIHNVLIFLIASIAYSAVVFLLQGTIKTILGCLVFTLMFKLIFKINIGKSLFTSIIYAVLSIFPDLIFLTVVTKVLNISKEFCHEYFAGSIISNLCVSAITITLVYILRKYLRKIINYNMPISKKIVLVSLMVLISLAIFFYNLINTFRLNNDIVGYVIVIITLMIVLFYLIKQRMDNDIIIKKYDNLLNIMKNYESDIEEQRIMIHETRNELATIKSKINDKEKESAIVEYIDSILGDKVSSEMSKYSKFKYLPSNGLRGFFYYKFNEAKKKEVNVSVNISKKIENSFLKTIDTKDFKDLVRIIGVYLDNAIEASEQSREKKLGIEIYMIKKDIEIIISNTFDSEINVNKIGIEKFTTKGKNRGHGLLLVKYIIRNNNIFDSNTQIINNLYIQKIRIKNY